MDTLYWLWLQAGLGCGAQNVGNLLGAYPGGAKEIYENRQGLAAAGFATSKQAARLAGTTPQSFEAILDIAQKQQVQVVCYSAAEYPWLLRNINSAPLVLYIEGDVALLNNRLAIGMVGARLPSAYGADAMHRLATDVAAAGACVVSGLAAGLDATAHKAALAAKGATVACTAFGHGQCYPAANRALLDAVRKNGAVVSEYPPGTGPEKAYFLQRNRLIAGLSHGLVVAEARRLSGTMSTAAFALEYGRDVFAVPGSIFSELSTGTNAMIQDGALLAAGAADILSVYGGVPVRGPAPAEGAPAPFVMHRRPWEQDVAPAGEKTHPAPTKKVPLPVQQTLAPLPQTLLQGVGEEARQVYDCLGTAPVGIGEVCRQTGLAPGRVMAALTELELAGLVRQLAGRQFTVVQ